MNHYPSLPNFVHRVNLPALVGALALLLACVGCGSLFPVTPDRFASVKIEGRKTAQISRVTTQVFTDNGYQGGPTDSEKLVFERPASSATTLSREGAVATYYGAKTVIRVRVEIVPLGGGVHRLQCQAYVVRSAGDSFFEDEVAYSNFRGGPYKELLKQVAEQLK